MGLVFRRGMWSCSGESGTRMRSYYQATARQLPCHLFIPAYFAVFFHSFTSFVVGYYFVWCIEIALFEAYTFDVPYRTEMATVERWKFVNMFVTENFPVILSIAKLPTRVAFWVLDWSAFGVAVASVSYWVAFVLSATPVTTTVVLILWNAVVWGGEMQTDGWGKVKL